MASFNIHEILPKVRERAEQDLGRQVNAEELNAIAVATIRELDMHLVASGDIVPSAPMVNSYDQMRQQNVRWSGGRKGR